MFEKASARFCSTLLSWARLGSLVVLLAGFAFSLACEDKGLGRPCDITTDASATQGAYIVNATDCPTRLCVKPAVQPGVSTTDFNTGAYCSAICKTDSDCDGQTRDFGNQHDTRCKKGFTCAPVFGEGTMCCTKLCLCRDFVPNSGPLTPDACQSGSDASCK